jgi:hypothetical protein
MRHIFAIRSESDRHLIEAALGVRFEPHESLYHGGDYWLARLPGDGDMRIRNNVDLLWAPGDPENERFAYPQHAAHALLLEVDSDSVDVLHLLRQLPALKELFP